MFLIRENPDRCFRDVLNIYRLDEQALPAPTRADTN